MEKTFKTHCSTFMHPHPHCGSAWPLSLYILISSFIRPHLPHPSWMNMPSSCLQIRVTHSSHLPTRILDHKSVASVIGIQSSLLVRCIAPGYKNHGNSTYTKGSHSVLFPGTNNLIHMRTHTQAWSYVKIALIWIQIHIHRGINTHSRSISVSHT